MKKITSKTNNIFFDQNGYLIVRDIIEPNELICELPKERGQITYKGDIDNFQHLPIENQVNGSLSRYSYPKYKQSHIFLKNKIESIIGKKLYRTYYYDRFYFSDQELKKHTDRDACEISISIHIGSNLSIPWNFELISLLGEHKKISLNPGDGVIYKGCDVLHWREKMPKNKNILQLFSNKTLYYHQAFFHYVLSDGYRCQYASDMA